MKKLMLVVLLAFSLAFSAPVFAQYSWDNGYNLVWLLGHNALKFAGPITFDGQPICLGGICISNWTDLNASINFTPTFSLPSSNITPGTFQSGLYTFTSSLNVGGTLFLPGYSMCTLKTNATGGVTCGSDATGITSLSQGTGISLSSNPITTTGTVSVDTSYLDSNYFNKALGITLPADNITNGTFPSTSNYTFSGDVQIIGKLYGGSPVKIAGGLNVTSGNATFGEIFVTSCVGCTVFNGTTNFSSVNVTNGTFMNLVVLGNLSLPNNSVLDEYINSLNASKLYNLQALNYQILVSWDNVTGFPGVTIPQANISTGILIPWDNVTNFTGITLPAYNLTNISFLNYGILVSQDNISSGIVIPIDNTTGNLNWSRVTGFPGVEIPQANITNGITIPIDNTTGYLNWSRIANATITGLNVSWDNVTGFPGISIPQSNITTGITIPVTNTTGGNSVQCSGNDFVVNVTLSNGVISTMCAPTVSTQKNTTGFYLYNDTGTYYFNETQLNSTIMYIINNTGITVNWSNVTGFPGVSIPQANITTGITIPFSNVTNATVYNESGIARNYTLSGTNLSGILPTWSIVHLSGVVTTASNSPLLLSFNDDNSSSYLYRRVQGITWLYQAVTVNPQKNITLEQNPINTTRSIDIVIFRTSSKIMGEFSIKSYVNSTYAPYYTTGTFTYANATSLSSFALSPTFTADSYLIVKSENQ